MPAEVYNANPTIFATSKTTKSSIASHSLWIDDSDSPRYGETDEPEPIDSDEIFGVYSFRRLCDCGSDKYLILQNTFGISLTRNIL